MKNTAQAAHISQMPSITSHFSISTTLENPVYLFACPENRRLVYLPAVLLYIGACSRLIRLIEKRITPGKVPIAIARAGRRPASRKPPPHKARRRVQPPLRFGCTFLFGGVRFAKLLVFRRAYAWYQRRKHG
jgi:hypothetical protein